MKTLLIVASLLFGGVAVGGGLYARLANDGPAPQVGYWSDGAKKSSVRYVEGVKEGPSQQWYASGQLECSGEYSRGLRHGTWTFWNEDGSVDPQRSGEYREGKRVAASGS